MLLLALASLMPPTAPVDIDARAMLERLRAVDGRLAGIAHRLTVANAPLCRDLSPRPGWAIHALGQYDPKLRDDARAVFGFDMPVAVEAVVSDGPAARAGVRANDAIVAVGGTAVAVTAPGPRGEATTRDAAATILNRQPVDRPLALELSRGGVRTRIDVAAPPGCPGMFEVLTDKPMAASADGSIVQIGVRFLERYPDAEAAVVIAHELAHNILRHRTRLNQAGVRRGLLRELGRNGRLHRKVESQADLLGVHLLRNAGYDPAGAARFWREHGGELDGGLFRSRTHPSSRARADAIAAEIAALPADAPTPYVPPILAERDRPLDQR